MSDLVFMHGHWYDNWHDELGMLQWQHSSMCTCLTVTEEK